MTESLGPLFDSLYSRETNQLNFPNQLDDFDNFLKELDSTACTKTWCKFKTEKELWNIPKVNLLLSDTTLLYGGGGAQTTISILNKTSGPQEFVVDQDLYRELARAEAFHTGFINYDHEVIARWVSEAADLIRAGKLAYLPERIVMISNGKEGDTMAWSVRPLKQTFPFNVLNPREKQSPDNTQLVSNLHSAEPLEQLQRLIQLEVPILESLPLSDYHKLIEDEHDAITRLRSALRLLLDELYQTAEHSGDFEDLVATAARIRSQELSPQLAQITQRFKRIANHRTLRIAGVTLGALALSASALLVPSVGAYAALLGAPGAGVIFKEYADYLKDKSELKENPYYFLWELSNRSANHRAS